MFSFKPWSITQAALILVSVSFVLGWYEIEMPEYDVLKVLGKNAEIRRYAASKWATISTQGAII